MGTNPRKRAEPPVSDVAKALARFRISEGMSVRRFAAALGYPAASSYQHYETGYKKDKFPDDFAEKVARYARLKGIPSNELLTLGINPSYPTGDGAAAREGSNAPRRSNIMALKEIDLRQINGNGEIATDIPVINEWQLPTDLVTTATNAESEKMRIVTVIGDAMAPTFRTGQKLMVDLSDTRPTPSGVFLIWDGLADDIRNVAYIPHSDPPRVRIFPENTKKYHEYERDLPDAHIRGRVLGLWTWV